MAKLPTKRAPQLMLLAQAAMAARDRWSRLEPEERQVLTRLLKQSGGRPGNLTGAEKQELKRIVKRLDVPGLGREVLPAARRHARRRRH